MNKRIIQARDIVRDVRSGMTDTELMEKYELSAKGLESAFTKLVNSGTMTVGEVYGQRRPAKTPSSSMTSGNCPDISCRSPFPSMSRLMRTARAKYER